MTDPLIDAAGTVHAPAGPDARILSLVPSITELLFDLGLEDRLGGRTSFCVHPAPEVKAVPSVGGTKRVNMEKVARIGATHVIVNVDETPKTVADALGAAGLTVIVTHPNTVEDNLGLYRLIGGIFDRADAAEDLCGKLEAELVGFPSDLPGRAVLYLIWEDPWMTVSRDTYIADVLARANWRTMGHDPEVRYPAIEMNEPFLADVDLVLFSTEPYSFTEKHVEAFRENFPGHAHKAKIIDAEMVSWYGSRAIPGLAYLRRMAERLAS